MPLLGYRELEARPHPQVDSETRTRKLPERRKAPAQQQSAVAGASVSLVLGVHVLGVLAVEDLAVLA